MPSSTTLSQRVERLRDNLRSKHPASQLQPLDHDQIQLLASRYPGIPEHLLEFYRQIGSGCIGDSGFSIYHPPMHAEEIYGEVRAKALASVCIVGDDFAGWCVGYDTQANWQFGGIEDDGTFSSDPVHLTLLDLIEDWYVKES